MRRLGAVLFAAAAFTSALVDAADRGRGTLLRHSDFRPSMIALTADDRAFLGYAVDSLPLAQRVDIDDDGIPDVFVVAHASLCGTGGCPVLLLDGRSGHRLGEFFGTIAVLEQREHGRAVIQVLSRRDIERTGIETHAFNGLHYRQLGHDLLGADAMNAWHERLESRR